MTVTLGSDLTVEDGQLVLDGKPLKGAAVTTLVPFPPTVSLLLDDRAVPYLPEILRRLKPRRVEKIEAYGLEKLKPSAVKKIIKELEDLGFRYEYRVPDLPFAVKEPQYSLVGWLVVYPEDKAIEPRWLVHGNDLTRQALERLPLLIKTAKADSLRAPIHIFKYLDQLKALGFDTSALDQLVLVDDLICLPNKNTRFRIKVKEKRVEPEGSIDLSGLQLFSPEGLLWEGISCNLRQGYLEIIHPHAEWKVIRRALHSPRIKGVALHYPVLDRFEEVLRLAEKADLEWISAPEALLMRYAKFLKENGYDTTDAGQELRLTDELYLSGTVYVWIQTKKVTARANPVAVVRGPRGPVAGLFFHADGRLEIREPTPYAAQAAHSPKVKRVRITQSALEGSPLVSEVYFV